MEQQEKSGWPAAFALTLVIVVFYLYFATRTTLFDRDEPRFAQATVEMVHSGNYLYPTFNGALRPDKPIMIYWLMALGVKLLGATELAVRLPSVLAAAGSALLTFWMGRRLWGIRTGLAAMAILCSTFLMSLVGTGATADSVLLFFLSAAMAVHADALMRGRMSARHVLLLGLAMGAATLTKGPVGLAVPILAILTTRFLLRPRSTGQDVHAEAGGTSCDVSGMASIWWAAAIGVVLFLAWGIPANRATGGQYAILGLGHHVIDRVIQPLENHGSKRLIAVFYYVPYLIASFFPWTLFLLGAGYATWKNRLGGARQRALLIGWTVPTFVLMSLVATKLPHYILPIWPALALAVAATLATQHRGELTDRDRLWLHRGGILFLPMVLIAIAIAVLFWTLPPWAAQDYTGLVMGAPLLKRSCALGAGCLAAMAAVTLWLHLNRRFPASAVTLFAGTCVVGVVASRFCLPAIEQLKPSPALAEVIRRHTGDDVPVTTCIFGEPTFNFYMGVGRVPITTVGVDGVAKWSRQSGPGVLVIPQPELGDALKKAQDQNRPLELTEIGRACGLVNSGVRTLDLRVMARHLSPITTADAR